MAASYSKTSPYYGTQLWGKFLDTWPGKTIQADVTDALYEIDQVYDLRPDLLANDLYQDPGLWWVFAVRNPDVLIDPLLMFTRGRRIYVPTKNSLQRQLGI